MATLTPEEQAVMTFQGGVSPDMNSAAANEWRDRWLTGSRAPSDPNAPTIAQVAWNELNGVANPRTTVPAGGETVGGGVFGGWSNVGAPVSATGGLIYSPTQTHESPFNKATPGAPAQPLSQATGGLLNPGEISGGFQPSNSPVSAPAPRPPTTGGTTGSSSSTPRPPSSTVGTTGQFTSNTGFSQAGAPGTPGVGQNAGYSHSGAQLLQDGTPWLDPATVAAAGKASAVKANPITRTVDPNELSGTRMNELLAQDSLLMQRARQMGLLEANRRGLGLSSIAVGAAMGAMADRAQPLALQEASAYGTVGAENMAARNVAENLNAQMGTDVSKVNAGMETDVNMFNTGAINRRNELMFDFNQKNFLERQGFNQEMDRIAALHANDLEKLSLTQQFQKENNAESEKNANLRQASSAAAAEFNSYSTIVQGILSDPKKPAPQVTKELAAAREIHYANMRTIETLHGVDLGDWQISATSSQAKPGAETESNFNSAAYLAAHPDVADPAKWKGTPYEHWVQFGQYQPGYDYIPLKPA